MNQEKIDQKVKEAIQADPNKKYIKKIYLFGSFLHNDYKPNSDVDLLFEPRKKTGFFKLIEIQTSLEKRLGRSVDLVTKNSLSKYLRKKVLSEARKIYDYS